MFVDDDSRALAVAATEKQRNVLISGEPGSGKSSVLYRMLDRARQEGRPVLMLGARPVSDSRALTDALVALAAEEGWIPEADPLDVSDPLGASRQVRRLREAPDHALILIDDLTTEQALTLFGQLRDELWQTPVKFTAAVRPEVAQALAAPPADVFFDQRVPLKPFDAERVTELLRRRNDAGESTLAAVFEPDVELQPRVAVAIAEEEGPGGRYDPTRQAELLRIAEEVAGRPGGMLVAELWGREGVSASDAELQQSLGLTRSRLTELLRTLTAAGVLVAYPEPRDTPGRPRMLYSISDR
ncbi:MAG: ATP-binding protein [Solirubrobacteraceae bacterium]